MINQDVKVIPKELGAQGVGLNLRRLEAPGLSSSGFGAQSLALRCRV